MKERLTVVLASMVGGGAVYLAMVACGVVTAKGRTDAGSSDRAAIADVRTIAPDAAGTVPIVTEWTSYVPTLTAESSGAVGSQTTKGEWRRVGDTLEVRILTVLMGTPTGATCTDHWKWS
jgi:hypothetical protein